MAAKIAIQVSAVLFQSVAHKCTVIASLPLQLMHSLSLCIPPRS